MKLKMDRISYSTFFRGMFINVSDIVNELFNPIWQNKLYSSRVLNFGLTKKARQVYTFEYKVQHLSKIFRFGFEKQPLRVLLI